MPKGWGELGKAVYAHMDQAAFRIGRMGNTGKNLSVQMVQGSARAGMMGAMGNIPTQHSVSAYNQIMSRGRRGMAIGGGTAAGLYGLNRMRSNRMSQRSSGTGLPMGSGMNYYGY